MSPLYSNLAVTEKEELVNRHAALVKRIAYQLLSRLPANILVDDLVQNGMLGLLDAIDRFVDGMGAQFETYAVQRIRGAMLDGLRDDDWVPRSVRREMRRVETAIQQLEHLHGRAPSESELAQALDMQLAEYQKLLADARGHQIVYLEELTTTDEAFDQPAGDNEPLTDLENAEMRRTLINAVTALPEREKTLMALYYEEELNLREVGEILGVTESRVCQLHSQAVARLRAAVKSSGKVAVSRTSGAADARLHRNMQPAAAQDY